MFNLNVRIIHLTQNRLAVVIIRFSLVCLYIIAARAHAAAACLFLAAAYGRAAAR
jgi:hypothetical protein